MLEGLDAVQWADVQHCYGRATDMPVLFHQLASGGAGALDAMSDVWQICHQGTVYSASAPCLPFLAELAASDEADPAVRENALALIYSIGVGKGYWQVHEKSVRKMKRPVPNDLARQIEIEELVVHECKTDAAEVANRLLDAAPGWRDNLLRLAPPLAALTDQPAERLRRIEASLLLVLSPASLLSLQALFEAYEFGQPSANTLAELATLDEDIDDEIEQGFLDATHVIESLCGVFWRNG